MNNNIKIGLVLTCLIGMMFTACKKEENSSGLSALNVVNAVPDLTSLKVNTVGKVIDYNNYSDVVGYGASRVYGILTSIREISGVNSAAPTVNLFSLSNEFKPGGLYSLYLVGQASNVEMLFKEESPYPLYALADSAIAVRVINLSSNSEPLNVTLSNTPLTIEFNALAYKQQSEFKKYTAKTGVTNIAFNFQVRNAAGTLLTSYPFTAANFTSARFKAVTLVIRGLVGGTGANALGVSFVGNY